MPGGPADGSATDDPRPASDPPPTEDDDEDDAIGPPRNPLVEYHFHGSVDATGARFGITDERATRRSTGRIEPDEVERRLRYYLAPPPYPSALAILRDRNVVVLPGEEDTGRQAGAYALLRELAGITSLISLSPTYSLAELGRYPFRAGQGYLVADRLGESTADQEQRFEAERLLSKLAAARAYLVVTTAPTAVRGWPGEVVVGWERPDPQRLLERCLAIAEVELSDPQLAQVRNRVAQRPAPRDVAALVDQIAASGVEAALSAGDDEDRQRVRQWFENTTRTRREVVEVATAAFAYGLPQRTFDRLCARLRILADAHALDGRVDTAAADDGALPPVRVARNGADGLITTVRSGLGGTRRVTFRSPQYRQEVLAQLVDRYGDELWGPVEHWLRDQAKTNDDGVRGALSLGLALYARDELDEVDTLLHIWADGTVAERHIAAYVLSWMCLHDDLAPAALRTATSWSVGAGPRRAWTAAVALGGEIGVRYQTEALRWLSHLSLREERVARPARESIAELFREAGNDPPSAVALLRFLLRWLRQAVSEHDVTKIRPALRVVVTVLQTERRGSTRPVAADMLLQRPEAVTTLSALWTEALRSAPHRHDAIEALRRTVGGTGQDPAAEQAVQDFAGALRDRWSGEERLLRLEQIEPAVRTPSPDVNGGRRLWKTFLEVLMKPDDDYSEAGDDDEN